MSWLISKGQDLPTAAEVHGTVSLTDKFWPGERRSATLVLLAADVDQAPCRSTEAVGARSSQIAYY
jgi:hypothetical protein